MLCNPGGVDLPSLCTVYDVGVVIGKGGFATVRRGIERKTGEPVALKILNPKSCVSSQKLLSRSDHGDCSSLLRPLQVPLEPGTGPYAISRDRDSEAR